MHVSRSSFALLCALLIAAVPLFASAAVSIDLTGTSSMVGWPWWSTASASAKALVVQGELSGLVAGYDEATVVVSIVGALVSDTALTKVATQLQKAVPHFSKTTTQYITRVDGVYADSKARHIPLGFVLLCLQDQGPTVDPEAQCLSSYEN